MFCWCRVIILVRIEGRYTCHYRLVEYFSVLRRGLHWDSRHHTRNGRSSLPAVIRSQNIINYTRRVATDQRISSAGLAIMSKRSFDIRLVILLLSDLVDGFFDLIEVLGILKSERKIL